MLACLLACFCFWSLCLLACLLVCLCVDVCVFVCWVFCFCVCLSACLVVSLFTNGPHLYRLLHAASWEGRCKPVRPATQSFTKPKTFFRDGLLLLLKGNSFSSRCARTHTHTHPETRTCCSSHCAFEIIGSSRTQGTSCNNVAGSYSLVEACR